MDCATAQEIEWGATDCEFTDNGCSYCGCIGDFAEVSSRLRPGQELPMRWSEYGSTQMGGVEEQHVVAAFNLDWLVSKLPIPDIIKIDVEGAELEVLSNQVSYAEWKYDQ